MLLKSLLTIRLFQTPMAFTFLISAAWVLYLTRSSPLTQSNPSHIFTTILRFLTPILTIPYTLYEIVASLAVLKGRDVNNKFTLRHKSRSFKLSRIAIEAVLGGLWFVSFIFSLGVGSWSMTGDSSAGFASTDGSASNVTTGSGSGNGTVIPATGTSSGLNTIVVPPGGKTPMVLGSCMWIVLIGLFFISALGVVVQTFREWRAPSPKAEMYDQEMGRMGGQGS